MGLIKNWAAVHSIASTIALAARLSEPPKAQGYSATHPALLKPGQRRKLYRGRDVLSKNHGGRAIPLRLRNLGRS